jgi:hypothetical protein
MPIQLMETKRVKCARPTIDFMSTACKSVGVTNTVLLGSFIDVAVEVNQILIHKPMAKN